MRQLLRLALLVAMLASVLPGVVLAQGGDGPVTAGLLHNNGDQGMISPQGGRWYRYDVGVDVEQVEFTLHFWPSDEVRFENVRLELYTAQQANSEMSPLGEGFALNRNEKGLPVGRRVWMGWLVQGTYYLRVVNESASESYNYMVNSGLGSQEAGPAPGPADTSSAGGGASPLPAVKRPSILESGVLGLRGLRPPAPAETQARSIDAILENSNNLYPADAAWMYEVQHGRVRYGQVRWYKLEIADKQERVDIAMHFWPSNGNIYHHVFFGVFTDYRLQVWQNDGPFQAIGVGGDTGFEEDRALVMNKKVWRGDLPHGVHYVGVWVDTDLANPELGDDKVDFVDFLLVPTFHNQPNLPLPVTNIPEWLARPLSAYPQRSGVLAGPRLTRPAAPPAIPTPADQPAPGSGTLDNTDSGTLAAHTNRWYKYEVKDPNGERLTATIEWKYSDGNTIHQAGFDIYDRFQFDAYLRDSENRTGLGFGIASTTGIPADYGPPVSRKVWKGVLPKGIYFIRVYNDSETKMDYSIRVARE